MFKKTLLAALALAGAASASALTDGEGSTTTYRVVIIWGDQFAAGTQYYYEGVSPENVDLTGVGAFFGASGQGSRDSRTTTWVAPSLTNGIDGDLNGLEWSAGIQFMGKRLTDDPVLVINLAAPGTDVETRYHFSENVEGVAESRWITPIPKNVEGQYQLDPNSTAYSDLQLAISQLPALIPAGSEIELSGIVFSCWNNANQRIWQHIENRMSLRTANAFESAEFVDTCDLAAYKMNSAIENTFRDEMGLLVSSSDYNLTSYKPRIIGFRRHDPEATLAAAGMEVPDDPNVLFTGGFLSVQRDLNYLIVGRHARQLPVASTPVLSPRLPISQGPPSVGWAVTFIGDMDALDAFTPKLQADQVALSPKANHHVALYMGTAIFN